jgi:hypothetical protein
MFIHRFAQSIRRQDWFAVLIEILVVLVGLVTAFQVDRWWEARGDRMAEATYLSRLISDIEVDIPELEFAIRLAEVRLGFGDLLVKAGADPAAALTQPGTFLAAVSQAAYTYTPALAAHTFEDLRSTGNLKLIRDADIKHALHDYYDYDQNQRQFISLNLMIEFRYFELAADVVTPEQYQFVQDRWFVVNSKNIQEVRDARPDAAGVRAAAERLSQRRELLAWLPKVRGLQVEQIRAHSARLDRSRALLSVLQAYATGFSE